MNVPYIYMEPLDLDSWNPRLQWWGPFSCSGIQQTCPGPDEGRGSSSSRVRLQYQRMMASQSQTYGVGPTQVTALSPSVMSRQARACGRLTEFQPEKIDKSVFAEFEPPNNFQPNSPESLIPDHRFDTAGFGARYDGFRSRQSLQVLGVKVPNTHYRRSIRAIIRQRCRLVGNWSVMDCPETSRPQMEHGQQDSPLCWGLRESRDNRRTLVPYCRLVQVCQHKHSTELMR